MSKLAWYTMARDSRDAEGATIEILDTIGLFGVSASDFYTDLKALGDVKRITLLLNSPGGNYYDAVAIHSMLSMHKAEITVKVIGVAASAASFIATVGDTVQIAANGFIMIHGPSTVAMGSEKEMRTAITMLGKIRNTMADAYAGKSGLPRDQVLAMMDEETWMDANEAVDNGFADEIIGAVEVTASFDVRRYSRTPPAEAVYARRNTEVTMTDKKKTPAETPEEMAARMREEIRAELVAETAAQAKADADAKAAAEAAAAGNGPSADDVRNEVAQIVDACAIAGVPEKAGEYIASKKSLSTVMAELKKVALANLGQGANERQTSNHNNQVGDQVVTAVNVHDIYAKWNAPKTERRSRR